MSEYSLLDVVNVTTGKLNSNAATINGAYPFFTCSPETLSIDTYSFDTEALLLAGNNAEGNFSLKYYFGKFDAYQRTYILTMSEERLTTYKYLFYLLKTRLLELKNNSAGSATKFLTLSILKDIRFTLPRLSEQQAIASVLSALDDKIDLLQRQNQTLEQMAATLFRQWFIEEAKEDWEEVTIGDIFTLKGGSTPSTKESSFWDGNISWTSPRDLSNSKSIFMFDTERKITEAGLAKISSGLLPLRTLLMSSRAPIGYLAMTDIEVAINQGYIAIPEHQTYSTEFMYLWCQLNMDTIENAGNGSVFQEISKSSFRDLIFVIPDENTLNRFDAVVKPTFAKIKSNTQQIRTLQSLRDTLLPKLISGEVRLKGFETLLQA